MQETRFMIRPCARPFASLAVLGALVAMLILSGCGRKGPLDPPPSAAVPNAPQQTSAPTGVLSPLGPLGAPTGNASEKHVGITSSGQAVAPKGRKKHIPLDVLLD